MPWENSRIIIGARCQVPGLFQVREPGGENPCEGVTFLLQWVQGYGEQVVINGQIAVTPGSKVRIEDPRVSGNSSATNNGGNQ